VASPSLVRRNEGGSRRRDQRPSPDAEAAGMDRDAEAAPSSGELWARLKGLVGAGSASR